jgi:ABC-type polysaccharide transport system permease subunit
MAQGIERRVRAAFASIIGRLFTWRRRQLFIAFLFVLPALINFAVFRYIPIWRLVASLYKYSLLGGYGDFIGLPALPAHIVTTVFWRS